MTKGPQITDEVKTLIAKVHKEHPKWTNTMIRNEVSSIVRKRDSSLPKGWPSKFAIDRIMPGIRERAKLSKSAPNPIDQPWTVQSMGNSRYEIPPEALPSVLQVWFFAKQMGNNLSIREALWVGRLHTAITDIEALYQNSDLASAMESLAEMAGIEDFAGTEAVNLSLFSAMTGHVITSKEAKSVGMASMGGPKGEHLYMVPWMGRFEANMLEVNMSKEYWDALRKSYEVAEKIKLERKGDAK